MNKSGMHLQRNTDFEELLSLGCQVCLGMQENLDTLVAIRKRQPDATLILRYYDTDSMQLSGQARAQAHFNYLTHAQNGVLPYNIIDIFSPINEQNLAHEHPGNYSYLSHPDGSWKAYSWWETKEGYQEQDRWTVEYIQEFKRLCAQAGIDIPLGGPALSPGHDVYNGSISEGPESEYKYLAESLKLWDYWFIHCYGDPNNEWYGDRWNMTWTALLQAAPSSNRPVYITEYNGGAFSDLLSQIDGMSGACWFLWASHDPNFQLMQFKNMPEQIAALKQYTASVKEEVQPHMPEFRAGFKDYVDRVGRDVIGDPVDDEHYLGDRLVYQPTTKGMLVWTKDSPVGAQFYPAYFPKA